ncbi:MAG TPA: GNAT family N-acetyltransferase [Rhodospirillales bacterium]|nr:GNAT family N-acetyltransferase [Rhodospirillales bacterium]
MLEQPIVRIRPGRPADAEAIARVYVESWRSAYAGLIPNGVLVRMSANAQAREWSQQLARRNLADAVLVADLSGAGIIGFGSCGAARRSLLPQAGEIFTLYVTPEHQERGIGRAMLIRLFDGLIDRGLDSAIVWVLAQNPARFFYEAMGGRRIAGKEERLWNTTLPQTAYGWDDLRLLRRHDTDRSA